jgi:hypothetical protein
MSSLLNPILTESDIESNHINNINIEEQCNNIIYQVVHVMGAIILEGIEENSDEIDMAKHGEFITVFEDTTINSLNNLLRVKIKYNNKIGWVSYHLSNGDKVIEKYDSSRIESIDSSKSYISNFRESFQLEQVIRPSFTYRITNRYLKAKPNARKVFTVMAFSFFIFLPLCLILGVICICNLPSSCPDHCERINCKNNNGVIYYCTCSQSQLLCQDEIAVFGGLMFYLSIIFFSLSILLCFVPFFSIIGLQFCSSEEYKVYIKNRKKLFDARDLVQKRINNKNNDLVIAQDNS